MRNKTLKNKVYTFVLSLILCPAVAFSDETIVNNTSAQCDTNVTEISLYTKLLKLSDNLDKINKAIGKPAADSSLVYIENASPREVYFEAENLYQKLDRLSYEMTGVYRHLPAIQQRDITLCDINILLDKSLAFMPAMNKRLNITNLKQQKVEKNDVTNADIFNEILNINNQINCISYQKTMPANVFDQVTLSIQYLENVLVYLKISNDLNIKNTDQVNVTPSVVYENLLQVLADIQVIYRESNLQMLTLIPQKNTRSKVPDDVLSLVKIVLAEVRYLATFLPYEVKFKTYNYGYKTPSEVYRQVQILKQQTIELKNYTKAHPDWVNRSGKQWKK